MSIPKFPCVAYTVVQALRNILVPYKAEAEEFKSDANAKQEEAEVRARTMEKLLMEVTKRVDQELVILKRVVGCGGAFSTTGQSNKLKVPEPKALNGARMPRSLRISCRIWSNISKLLEYPVMRG